MTTSVCGTCWTPRAKRWPSLGDGRAGDLDKNRQLVLALVKDVEIVGEAATQVTEPTRQRLPEIPWERIVGMRNRLVHAYFDINLDIVWKTVQGDLPELISLLKPAIPPERGSTPGVE